MKLQFHLGGTDSYVDLSIKVVTTMTKTPRKSKTSTWISFILHVDANHFLRSFISFLRSFISFLRSFISLLRGELFFSARRFLNIHMETGFLLECLRYCHRS